MARAIPGGVLAHAITGLVFAAIGAGLIFFVREQPYWLTVSAGPGFLPVWVGGLLVIASLAYVVQVLRGAENLGDEALPNRRVLLRIGTIVVATLIASQALALLGFRLVSTILLFVFFSLQGLGTRREIAFHLALSVGLSVLLYTLFKTWLEVQLPVGIW